MPEYVKIQSRERFMQAIQLGSITSYNLFGWGVSDSSIEYEADEENKRFITQKTGRNVNKGYTLSTGVEQEVFADDPLFKEIDKIRRGLLTGEKARGKLLNVNLYDSDLEQPTSVSGEEVAVEVVVTNFGGPADSPLSISYTLNFQGAPVLGDVALTWGEDAITFAFTKEVVAG